MDKVLRADEGLYSLYTTVMTEHCKTSDGKAMQRIKSILGQIICAQEPLSLHTLVHLVPPDSIVTPNDLPVQRQIVRYLSSLLYGTHSDDTPIVPIHSSFRDFLCNREHGKDFYIDGEEANRRMSLACFRVMDQYLTFNICEFPTSFLRNSDVSNIAALRETHIPHHLSYASRFWSFHVSAAPIGEIAQECMLSFFQKDFLPWLEVMSLTRSSSRDALALLSSISSVSMVPSCSNVISFRLILNLCSPDFYGPC
jgi:hypothetical protein